MDKKTYIYKRNAVNKLPRGGFLIETSSGIFQYGAPPETIKDTMVQEIGVPFRFIMPNEMFNWFKGISIGEIEFPIYFNYFLKKRKTQIFCRDEQVIQIKKVLQEALFGPKEFDVFDDFDTSNTYSHIPDLMKEMKFFRSSFSLDDVVEFYTFNNDNIINYENIKIINDGQRLIIFDSDKKLVNFPGIIEYKAKYLIGERLVEPYKPPMMGVTCLGPSHGFDPTNNTSGFLLWINHRGIMVDPPVNSTEWLINSNVSPKLIDSIILTHCHADHDAGTFQKILEEGRITLYTTRTIMDSFLKKYSALSNVDSEKLKQLFTFQPIKINRSVFIHGAEFNMFYTLHSIPSIGFKMFFEDFSMVYSSDHNNDPDKHRELFDKGVIDKKRYDEFRNFPWDADVIFHESGIPPLHTPIAYLNSLNDDIKSKIYIYHIAQKDIPEESSLKVAKFGIENTLYFDIGQSRFEKAYQILGVLNNLDFFADMPISKAQEFLTIVEEEFYKKGDKIIEKGSKGDKFYIIYMGNVSVDSGDALHQKKLYGTYDYFGEVALVTKSNRAADVFAETDVVLYTIERDKFLNFIAGTEFEKTLQRLAKIRTGETWNLLSKSNFFKLCTSTQKTWLESIFIPIEKNGKGVIYEENVLIDYIYIIRSGEIIMEKDGIEKARLKQGDFIGALNRVYENGNTDYSFRYEKDVRLFGMKREDIVKFAEANPGLLMKLKYDDLF